MLYTYARASSILQRVSDSRGRIDSLLLNSELEVELITLISKFDLNVEKAVRMLAPKWIAHYSFELCEAFNRRLERFQNRVGECLSKRAQTISRLAGYRVLGKDLDVI
jgi:arginyl-tRNA synthetase